MIHPKAVIDKRVVLGEDVRVGAYAVLEKGVELGRRVIVSPFAHLKGDTSIGDDTFIGTGVVIGEAPQMLEASAEGRSLPVRQAGTSGGKENIGKVCIGTNNIIREYVTINSAISSEEATSLGNNNFLMAFSHIAHDCKLANGIVVCNGTLVAGHVEVQDKAFISGNVVIHQFVRIGKLAMIGGLSRVNQDVPPFMMAVGDSRIWGLNLVGLRRAGFSKKDIGQIKKAYNFLYRKKLSLKRALVELERIESDKVKRITVFILSSIRGICGPQKSTFFEKIFLDYPYFLRNRIPTYDLFLEAKKINEGRLRSEERKRGVF